MKRCTKCGDSKPGIEFHRNKKASDGLDYRCKLCRKYAEAARYKENPLRHLLTGQKWARENPKKCAEIMARWRKKNPEKIAAMAARTRKKCAAKWAARAMARHAQKLRATPAWGNEFFISEAYDLANLRTRLTGIRWEVDHIVPLKSKLVCGLHVEHNLQVIPKAINREKSNRHWPSMPEAIAA